MFAQLPLPDPSRPVLIAGPTASGKSALALRIAQAQGRAVVNADALQVHDSWRVLTARPDAQDEALVPHLLYGHVARDADYSVGHWLREVAPLLADNPVIVGGTGLYFTALTEGLAEIPSTPPEIRAEADALLRDHGLATLLADLDPQTAARLDQRNPARVQRAWEVLRATGKGLAAWQDQTGAPLLPIAQATGLVLTPRIDWLNDRIGTRFDTMLATGALIEAHAALPHWPEEAGTLSAPLWTRAIGAPELIAHLQNHMSLENARDSATLATRQYAKRQRSWFRNRMKSWNAVVIP
ncbi:tRNA (adenosine(37)-N6)-dimethylallyltransferase MiaA [Pararhodobacter zhoushanensis]|uniref:tRNA dimethylallyltransferase n=1 Tax=Pararhodobacter zhoushanensis TaxID=2479545 RepID=A0ABT3GYX6_9RHOB|nr:tRNA (adenosine(37)-N6)-dimethylallyltransferase MiaA [Pararhodobacter zhoushanensis]MCW1932769.1 tRNA (adenosine(37)-N6)-dimethylallyltransferase MiaA [Pararhodobacter zhoushanensis]